MKFGLNLEKDKIGSF